MIPLIFDLDGTLIDSAPDIHATANRVFGALGAAPIPFDVVRGFIGNGVGVLVERLCGHLGLTGKVVHADLVANFLQHYETAFDLTQVYPGVVAALDTLAAQGHPLGICTNKPEGPARAALHHFGLDRHMQVVIGGDTIATRKPHPTPLQAALAALGAETAIFVGDSEVDAATAKAADQPFALFTQGYRKTKAEALGAKLIFDDYAALPGLVTHLAARL